MHVQCMFNACTRGVRALYRRGLVNKPTQSETAYTSNTYREHTYNHTYNMAYIEAYYSVLAVPERLFAIYCNSDYTSNGGLWSPCCNCIVNNLPYIFICMCSLNQRNRICMHAVFIGRNTIRPSLPLRSTMHECLNSLISCFDILQAVSSDDGTVFDSLTLKK